MPDETKWDQWSVPLDGIPPRVLASRDREGAGGTSSPPRAVDAPNEAPAPSRSRLARTGFFITHPRYRAWLAKCGVTSADTALSLPGEVVCGHVDRHVVRVELHSGSGRRIAYLKREHAVGRKTRLRSRLAGFGWVSRCEREAGTLARLETAGLPGPQWLAYGEDAAGRAFVLVDELAGAVELRAYLGEFTLPPEDRRVLAERIGRTLAELHAAGFGTPELAAKHLLVQPGSMAVSLIDWQSCPQVGTLDAASVTRWFATLHATLADELATPQDRLRVLWAYRRTQKMTQRKQGGTPSRERFGRFVRSIVKAADGLERKSSVRAQRQPVNPDVQQRLVWLADEAVVAIPEVAAVWPTPVIAEPFYPATPTATPSGGHREWVTFADGRRAVVVRFTTTDPFGRLAAAVRERPWRSPAATAARVLFHLEKHDIPAPRLLAFGQRLVSKTTGESFLVGELPPNVTGLTSFLAHSETPAPARRTVLRKCGRILRQLHDAGCRPATSTDPNDPLFVITGEGAAVSVGSPFAVRLVRRVGQAERKADLKRLTADLPRADRARVLRGYLGAAWADRKVRKQLTAKVV